VAATDELMALFVANVTEVPIQVKIYATEFSRSDEMEPTHFSFIYTHELSKRNDEPLAV